MSALLALPGVQIAESLEKGAKLGPEQLRKLAASRAAALTWGNDPQNARDLARAYHGLIRWVSLDNRKSIATATMDASVSELRARPVNATAWWRLGAIETLATGGRTTPRSALYLWRSVEVQPHAMTLLPRRLHGILLNWPRFAAADQRELHPQFLATWRGHRRPMLKLAANARYRAIIRRALADDPEVAAEFEKALVKKKR